MNDIPALKAALRRKMRGRLADLPMKNPEASAALRDRFMTSVPLPDRAVIAGYIAQGYEIDPLPLMRALEEKGHTLALPVIGAKDAPLTFRRWSTGDELVLHATLSVSEPIAVAEELEPDILLTPLLAFDLSGHRLGRGAGYFDRTLTALRKRRTILAVGLAFASQQLSAIPYDKHDAKLDKIVTEIQAHTI
ncbi:MAG: 5-formyltetrahydrofolate cyclo-ligase [Bdellovibrionales bacterium]